MPSQQRSRLRLALYAATVVAGLVALVYVALPFALAGWLQAALAGQGFSDVRIRIGYPGLHRVHVDQFALSYHRGGRSFQFNAHSMQLDYDLPGLVAGRLQRMHVPQAALRVATAPTVDDTHTGKTPAPVAVPVPGEWIAGFPLQALDVDRIDIEWREGDQPPFVGTLQGEARRDAEHLRSRWTLAEGNRPHYEFELDLAVDGALNVALYRSATPPAPLLRANVSVTPQEHETLEMRGSIEAHLKPLALLLAPWIALPPTVAGLDGQLEADWHGTAPAALPASGANILHGSAFEGSARLDATVARIGSVLQEGRLHLDVGFESHDATLRWRTRDNLRLSAYLNPALLATRGNTDTPFVRTPKPLVIRAPRVLSGELAVDPAEVRFTITSKPSFVVEQLHVPSAVIPALTATLARAARVSYRPSSGQWDTGGLAIAVKAPAIQPQYAEIGTLDDLAVSVAFAAGPLNRLPPLHIEDAAVTLLGGRVQARNIRYDGTHDSSFAVNIAHLDLARVVALEQQQGIEASGLLDGNMPVTLGPRGLSIANGKLQAQPPGGVIRYQGTDRVREMAATNPNLKLVLNALGNYRYEKLDVGVNYAEGGDLVLQLGLAGRNPDWNAGQPIHLNININENIPALLRSLRLADDISIEIEKRMKERSRPTR